MRLTRYLGLAAVLLAALLTISWWWLLHTDAGARFAVRQAESLLGGVLSAGGVSGDFGSGLRLQDVRVSAGDVVVEAATASFALDVDLLPISLRVSSGEIETLEVTVESAGKTDRAPFDIRKLLRSLQLPFWLLIDELAVRDATLRGSAMSRDLGVHRLELRVQWFEHLYVDRLRVDTGSETLVAEGDIDLSAPHRLHLDADLDIRRQLVGPDDRAELTISADGNIERLAIESAGRLVVTGYSPFDVQLRGNADTTRLVVDGFRVAGEDLRASGSGMLAWVDQLSASGTIDLAHANVHAYNERWPASHPVSGRISVDVEPGLVRIGDSELSVVGTAAELRGNVDIDTSTKLVEGSLDWTELEWPVASRTPDVSSSSGSIDISGTIDAWRVDGRISVEAAGVDEGSFVLDGIGDRQHVSVNIREASLLGGELSGRATYNWTGRQAWSAALDMAGIRTGPLASGWPGTISGNVRAGGRARDRFLVAELESLRGRLREREFVANGGFTVDGRQVIARELTVSHGRSDLRVDGDLHGPDGLSFDATVTNLSELLPQVSGAFEASGRVSLNESGPFLRIDGGAPIISYNDIQVTNLRLSDAGNGIVALSASADDVSVAGELIAAPRLTLEVTEGQQSLSAAGTYRDLSFTMSLAGRADQWDAPTRWDGELREFSIDGDGTTATLDDAARVALSSKRLQLERACVTDATDAGACLQIDWAFSERMELGASVTRVPLGSVNNVRDTGFVFDQLVNGTVQWRQIFGERATGSGNISISRGSVAGRDRPGFVVNTDVSTIAFNILEGQLLAATIDIPMPGTGHIDGQFRLLDVTSAADSGVDGELAFDLSDISILSVLSPLVDTAAGRLQGNISIAGSVSAPRLSGDLALNDGSVSYLPIGLHLEDIRLDGELANNRRLFATGSFGAGEGRGEIVLSADYGDAATGLDIAVQGSNLTVIDVRDLLARGDVDLRVAYLDDTLTLGGNVVIPHARVKPENLPTSRASVSDDVVIVAGDLPGGQPDEPASGLNIEGAVTATLEDDVVIDLDVARASLSGTVTFDWNGPAMPVANGRYELTGNIEAFGQVLDIVEGGVRFPGVPANNPLLRVRAEREIFGNSQVKTAGVLVSGTLARPTIEAYTYPSTTEQRALTLLVTGSDFNYEQGVGAVDFGTYVAPRLFVSYGVGLFGRDNVISARYDLARGFGIKATSGQSESGIDLIYRFER